MFFWNSLPFSMIQQILAIWSLVLLSFLKPALTSGISSSYTVEASLGGFWAILCYCVRQVQLCNSLSIVWHCLSLGLEWKLTFPVLWPLLSFPNLLAYRMQHFNIIMLRSLLVIINSYSWSDNKDGNLTSPPKTTKISCQILRLSHSFCWFRTLQCQ